MDEKINLCYQYWLNNLKSISTDDYQSLLSIKDEKTITDLFFKDLTFGTGGLRGVMGLGSNRLNFYTIYRATHGLALYLKSKKQYPKIVIGYDSRKNSFEFAFLVAKVMSNLGIESYLFKELIPTPIVSYAIRKLKADGGVIITSSHNPREYNGYKVYNDEGSQITLKAAQEITTRINSIDLFKDYLSLTSLGETTRIHYIDEKLIDDFIQSTLRVSLLNDFSPKDVNIVYTPLNGTGLKPVLTILEKAGFKHVSVPALQRDPDENFTTCPFPNPELKEALTLGIQLCHEVNADLLLATDPDCDRCGIGVKYHDQFLLLSGNEVAILLLNFFLETKDCSQKELVHSIVSTSLVDHIADKNGIEVKHVLTGFKYIGEEINRLEKEGQTDRFLFGFEESYGYLTNTEVRDKDAVNAALIIAEMFYYYKVRGINLIDKLEEIYQLYCYNKNILLWHTFAGKNGMEFMNETMHALRQMSFCQLDEFFHSTVIQIDDFLVGKQITSENKQTELTLPQSDVLIFYFNDGARLAIRPSGTEPKLKCYIEVICKEKNKVEEKLAFYQKAFERIIGEKHEEHL